MSQPLMHNGQAYTNADAWRTAKATKAPKMSKPIGEEMEGQEPEDGAAIAEEHGPATEVHMTHDHEMGVHHVSSKHPDGHEHESDHESAEAAHEHGKKLAAVGAEEHGEPDGDEGEEPWGK